MTATCIAPNDVTEQFLDDPSWQGLRVSHMVTLAKNEAMWLGPYAEIRRDYDKDDPKSQHRAWMKATEFYRGTARRWTKVPNPPGSGHTPLQTIRPSRSVRSSEGTTS